MFESLEVFLLEFLHVISRCGKTSVDAKRARKRGEDGTEGGGAAPTEELGPVELER